MTPTRATLVLEVEPEVARFLNEQPNTADPSQLVNQLLRRAKEESGLTQQAKGENAAYQNEENQALQDFIDEDTPAAG